MSAPDFSVAGQHVLISGGTGGIGTAFARAFRDSGATVTICDVRPPSTNEGFRFEPLDVRDDAAVTALAEKIDTLHVLIHCAGRLIRHEEHKPEVFRDIVDIHLVGRCAAKDRAEAQRDLPFAGPVARVEDRRRPAHRGPQREPPQRFVAVRLFER